MREGRRNGARSGDGGQAALKTGMEMVVSRSSEARKQLGVWRKSLGRQIKEHPVRTFAIALGAGYLVGGGLFSRLTARLVSKSIRLGLRFAVVPLVTSGIVSVGQNVFALGDDEAKDDDSDSSEATSGTKPKPNRNHSAQKETHP